MGVKWTTKKNDFPSMERTLEGLNGRKVNVGCLDGAHAWLAAIHEYGCKIPVTPKMRAYLHHNGLHLSPKTTTIVIPERSFLRTGYDENIDKVLKKTDALLSDVLAGRMSEDTFLKAVGITLSSEIKDYARDLDKPANHPFTKSRKKSDNPLWDTGQMIGGITYEIE